jgi:hypothetical protein
MVTMMVLLVIVAGDPNDPCVDTYTSGTIAKGAYGHAVGVQGIMTASDRVRALELDPHMPRTRWKLAIPFVSKDVPSRSSEFAHPDVVIGLSFLAYRYDTGRPLVPASESCLKCVVWCGVLSAGACRYEGLRYEDLVEVVTAVTVRLSKEVGPVADRKTNKLYVKWVRPSTGQRAYARMHEARTPRCPIRLGR